jgi:hypothetical protein
VIRLVLDHPKNNGIIRSHINKVPLEGATEAVFSFPIFAQALHRKYFLLRFSSPQVEAQQNHHPSKEEAMTMGGKDKAPHFPKKPIFGMSQGKRPDWGDHYCLYGGSRFPYHLRNFFDAYYIIRAVAATPRGRASVAKPYGTTGWGWEE